MHRHLLRPAWIEIDLPRLESNIRAIKKKIGNTKLIGVVKSDAYGHGAVMVSKALLKYGAAYLAVATVEEAIELRQNGITSPIMMLGLVPDQFCDSLIQYDIIPLVSSYENAVCLSGLAAGANKTVPVMIKLDTGMGRIGFLPTQGDAQVVAEISALPGLRLEGVLSHFSSADLEDLSYSYQQLDRFNTFCDMLDALGTKVPLRNIANSPAIMRLPESYLDAVRPGTLLWGCYPDNAQNKQEVPLQPVMSVKASVVYIKTVPAGVAISYGRKFVTQRTSNIATVPMGYADGYTRLLIGKARVLIHGEYVPVLGTICMDQFMIDVTDIDNVKVGDEVVILGTQGNKEIPIAELCGITGLCSGELFYGFCQRLPRIYIGQQ